MLFRLRYFFLSAALAAACFLLLPAGRAQAATCTWDGSSNNWGHQQSWSCVPALAGNAVPGAADDVIINGGTLTLNQNQSARSVALSGGTLDTNSRTLTVGAGAAPGVEVLAWTDGTINGGGTVSVAGGSIRMRSLLTSLVLNGATLTAGVPLDLEPASGLLIIGGTLNLNGGASVLGGINGDSAARIAIASAVSLAGGAQITTGTLELQSGSLSGPGQATASMFLWSGGTLSAATHTSGLDFTTTAGARVLNACALTADGAAQNGAGSLSLTGGAALTLYSGGEYSGSISSDPSSSLVLGSGRTLTIGSGAASDTATFNGPLVVSTGVLRFRGGTVTFGSAAVLAQMQGEIASANTAALNLPAEPVSISTLTLGEPNITTSDLPQPVLNMRSSLAVGTLNWGGGTIRWAGSGAPVELITGALNLYAAPSKTLSGLPARAAGTAAWTGAGTLNLNDGAHLTTLGTVTVSGSGSGALLSTATASQPGSFTNQGGFLYNRSTTSRVEVAMGGSGPLTVQQGTLELGQDADLDGSIVVAQGAALNLRPAAALTARVNGACQIAGTMNANSGTLAFSPSSSLTLLSTGALRASSGGTLQFNGGLPLLNGTFDNQGAAVFDQGSVVAFGATAVLSGLGSPVTVDGASVTLPSGSRTLGTLNLQAGSFSSPSALEIDALNWSGGALSGGAAASPPSTTVTALNLAGSGSRVLSNRSMEIGGELTGALGSLHLEHSAQMVFSGGGTLGAALSADSSTSLRFDNSGAEAFHINGPWSVSGAVAFIRGAVNFNSAATLTSLGGTVEISGGQVVLDSGDILAQIPSLALSSGSLGGADALSIAAFQWTGGTLGGGSQSPVPQVNAASLSFSGSGTRVLAHRMLQAASLTTTGSGSLSMENGAAFTITGGTLAGPVSIDATSTLELNGVSPSLTAQVSGAGTLRLVGSAITSTGAFSFGGTLEARNSSVTLAGGGAFGSAGAGGISADSASRVEFAGGSSTTTIEGTFDIAGEAVFTSGNVAFGSHASVLHIGSPVTICGAVVSLPAADPPVLQAFGTLNLSSGRLSSPNAVEISVLNWSGGEIDGSGAGAPPETTVAALNISVGGTMALINRAMSVADPLTGSGTSLALAGGASMALHGGSFNLPVTLNSTSSLGFSGAPVTASGSISGAGTVTFQADATLNAPYSISGSTALTASRVAFPMGALFGGALTADADSTLVFSGGSAGFSEGTALGLSTCDVIMNGASAVLALPAAPVTLGGLHLSAGTLTARAALQVADLRWSGGTLQGSGAPAPQMTASGPVDLTGSGDRFLDALTLTAGNGISGGGGSLSLIHSAVLRADGGSLSVSTSLSSGSSLRINGQPFTVSGAVSGPGAVLFGADSPVEAAISGAYNVTGSSTFQSGVVTFTTGAAVTSLGSTVTIDSALVTDGAAFNNNGAVQILSGALALNNGGSVSGSIQIGSGGTLDLNAGAFTISAALTGPGTFESGADATLAGTVNCTGPATVNGGTLTLSPAASITTLGAPVTISGASVQALSPLNNTGAIRLIGGTLALNQGGTLANSAGGEGISLDASSLVEFSGGTLVLSAEVRGAGTLRFGSLATHTLSASVSGLVNLSGETQFYSPDASPFNTVTFQPSSTLTSLGSTVTIRGAVVILPNAAVSIPTLALSAGRLSGPAQISATALEWSGGQIDGAGASTRPATLIGSLTVSGPALKTLDGRDAAISGPAAWDGSGALNLNRGAALAAQSTFTVNSSGPALFGTSTSSQPGSFTTAGSFTLQPGCVTQASVPFHNTGTLEMHASQLSLYGGGLFTGASDIDGSSWLRFSLGAFTLDAASSVTGAGQVSFEYATVTLRGAYHLTGASTFTNGRATFEARSTPQDLGSTVTISGGTLVLQTGQSLTIPNLVISSPVSSTLSGPDPLVVDALDWSAGTIGGAGSTPLQVSSLSYTGAQPHTLSGRVLRLSGSAQWTGMGTLVLSQAVLETLSGSSITLNQEQDSVMIAGQPSSTGVEFRNQGTLDSAGTYVAQINAPLSNAGAVNVQNGTLVINQSFVQNAGGSLNMQGGALLVNSSNKTLNLAGGSLSGSGIIDGSVINLGAMVDPGSPFGTLEITGQYTQQAGGTLQLDLSDGAFDRLVVHGAARLGGTLAASVSEPPALAPVRAFPVLAFASASGSFSSRSFTDLGSGRSLLPIYDLTSFSLAVIETGTDGDLSIAVANDRGRVVIDSTAAYTVTVANNGPNPVRGALVSAALPSTGWSDLAWTCEAVEGSCSSAGGAGPVAVSVDLAPGAHAVIALSLRVGGDAPNPFTVTAQVQYPVDPDLRNNRASDSRPPILEDNFYFAPFTMRGSVSEAP